MADKVNQNTVVDKGYENMIVEVKVPKSPSIEMKDGKCVIHPGPCVPIFKDMDKCRFEKGSCMSFIFADPNPDNPKGNTMSDPVKPVDSAEPVASAAPAAPSVSAMPVAPPAPSATTTSVGMPEVPDISKFFKDGNITGGGIVAATIAVAGCGAAWKFYSQFSKQRHERQMAQEERKSDEKDHSNCTASAAVKVDVANLSAKVSAQGETLTSIEKKLSEMESKMKKGLSLGGGNTEELEEKIEDLEKKIKKLLPKRGPKSKSEKAT